MQTCIRVQICLAMFVVGLGLPAQAGQKMSQAAFVADCNDDGLVTVGSAIQLEVVNFAGLQGVVTTDCTVTLAGGESGLTLAEDTDLLFQGALRLAALAAGPERTVHGGGGVRAAEIECKRDPPGQKRRGGKRLIQAGPGMGLFRNVR